MKLDFLILLALWNLIVFIIYAIDKWKAVHDRWRISEKILLSLSILAGGIGALLAGKIVRHKTRKWYFWLVWILGLIVDIGLIYFIGKL